MIIKETRLSPVKIIEPEPFMDERGFFNRIFCMKELSTIAASGIKQINHSMTAQKGSIRGMHFQYPPYAETKIVRCIKGSIFDVAIDLRAGSPTFLQWYGEVLSAANMKALVIPEGFAHGFQSLEDNIEIIYMVTAPYNKENESAVRYNDPAIDIKWPEKVTVVSEKDAKHPDINDNFKGIEL